MIRQREAKQIIFPYSLSLSFKNLPDSYFNTRHFLFFKIFHCITHTLLEIFGIYVEYLG